MYTLVQHPPVPFTTLMGSTRGPAVFIGRDRSERNLYVGEPETRGILKAFGWPMPETHARVKAERDQLAADVVTLEAELAEARDVIASYEQVVQVAKPAEAQV